MECRVGFIYISFSQSVTISRQHMQTESDERRISCECGAVSARNSNLEVHMLMKVNATHRLYVAFLK